MTDLILHGTSHLIVTLMLGLRKCYQITTRQSHSNCWKPIFTIKPYLFTVEGTKTLFEGGASNCGVLGEEIIEKTIKASSSTKTNGTMKREQFRREVTFALASTGHLSILLRVSYSVQSKKGTK